MGRKIELVGEVIENQGSPGLEPQTSTCQSSDLSDEDAVEATE